MKISYLKVENESLIQISHKIAVENWKDNLDWVDIRFDSQKEVVDYFRENSVIEENLDYIENPEGHPFAKEIDNKIILNINISNKENIYDSDYLTVIIESGLIITVIPESAKIIKNLNEISKRMKKNEKFLNSLLFSLIANVLSQSNENMGIAQDSIHKIKSKFNNDPETLSPSKLMSVERNISKLSDIIEDQYVGFEILSSLTTINQTNGEISPIKELIKGFEPLNKTMGRLEKLTESYRLQFMLIQQQKSTRKINTLTIIQAVFVPLTFIAGVYGMNFVNIPEINFENGYFIIWGVFVLIASALLAYFYKNGWFD